MQDSNLLYIAIGILGATVMPHNLYLHSALVMPVTERKEEAIFYSAVDVALALTFAFFVNAGILVMAAALFHKHGLFYVAELQDAYNLFTPLVGTHYAGFLFALALLLAGQNSTLTGTLAGQIIMEGFLDISLPLWLRRLVGRLVTIVPAFFVLLIWGEGCISTMLLFSQVILSLQLPFAMIPLINFTNSRRLMGNFANGALIKIAAYMASLIIIGANSLLIYFFVVG